MGSNDESSGQKVSGRSWRSRYSFLPAGTPQRVDPRAGDEAVYSGGRGRRDEVMLS